MPASPPPSSPEGRRGFVPAHTLVKSKKNVRRTNQGRNIPALADSILKEGLLQNLIVSRDGDTYPVEGGERRRLAIAYLVKKRKIPRDWPVPVYFVDDADRTAASATENIHRERMHPADEFRAFATLTAEGWTIDEIADEYGVTPLVVERRLALTSAAPALLALFRKDEITTEQLMALCSTDDHGRQVSAWNALPTWNRDPANLRRAVTAGEVEASDPRVAFIGGVNAFVEAGGDVRRDLFSNDAHAGFITDSGLLDLLVARRLDAEAEVIRSEGWGWVEVWPRWDWTEYHRLGRIHEKPLEIPPELAERMTALQGEYDLLADDEDTLTETGEGTELFDTESERLEVVWSRMEAIETEIAEIGRACQGFDPVDVTVAGAIVAFDRGQLRVERGMVRASDRTKLERGGNGHAVTGGRSTEVGGRKSGGSLSDALTRSLFGYRNLAAQTVTAANPHIAKVLLACWSVQSVRSRWHHVPVDLRIAEVGSGTRTQHAIADEGGEPRRQAFDRIGADLIAALPADDEALWDALMLLSSDELDRINAFAVASSVSLNRDHKGLTAKLLQALNFDMAEHFRPTAGNYLGRVSKAQIVEALAEAGKAGSDAQRSALEALKKADLAARAERELANAGWVPTLIRTPVPQPVPEAPKSRAKRGGGTGTKAVKPRRNAQAKTRTSRSGRRAEKPGSDTAPDAAGTRSRKMPAGRTAEGTDIPGPAQPDALAPLAEAA